MEKVLRLVVVAGCSTVTALVCYGRVYLLYHTVSQVIVGALIGVTFGALWFIFVHALLTPYVFPRIVSWKISELLLIRDTSLIPNILFFEYSATRQECRARSRKNMKMQ
jgi:dolichyldiphosphatase